MEGADRQASAPSSLGSLRLLGAGVLALGRIRLELLSLEVAEERDRWVRLTMWGALSALLWAQGLFFAALAMTVWGWEEHRLLACLASAALLCLLALGSHWKLARALRSSARALESSVSELRSDEIALRASAALGESP